MNRTLQISLLVLIIAVAAFFRLWQLDTTPPGLFPDEAMNGNNLHEALGTGDYKIFYRENNGREGLFINLQAISVSIFGHTAFALRLMAALFGIASVIALWGLTRAYTKNDRIALLAAFFMATSFWHILLSRIGFRANMAPFFLCAGLWGLYAAWNKASDPAHARTLGIAALGGLFFGLGFHSYIAYRIAPIIALPVIFLFIKKARETRDSCILCIPAVFVLAALIAASPLLLYFAQHPEEFFGRTSQISIFSQPSPLKALGINIAKTIGMFYIAGDFNWRHNFAGAPALWWPVAIFFTVGVGVALKRRLAMLFIMFGAMLLPVVISSEGLPHALRAIILIPSVMIFAAIGFDALWQKKLSWLHRAETRYPEATSIIIRIRGWVSIFAIAVLAGVCLFSFNQYFQRWSINPYVGDAYEEKLYAIGLYVNGAPEHIPKYIITNEVDSIDITGRPMSFQPILFVTKTYRPDPLGVRNIHYLALKDASQIVCDTGCMVFPVGREAVMAEELRKTVPSLKAQANAPIFILTPDGK